MLLLPLCGRRRWRRTLSWPFLRPGSWSGRRLLSSRCWPLCWCGSRRWLLTRSCRRAIRRPVGRTIVWLDGAWRTVIGSGWPRVRLRLRVRLSYRAISWSVRWLRSIHPVIIGRRRRTVRWPVIRLHGVRLRRRPTFCRSIPRLFIIHSARSVPGIVLRLPRLPRTAGKVALTALRR